MLTEDEYVQKDRKFLPMTKQEVTTKYGPEAAPGKIKKLIENKK